MSNQRGTVLVVAMWVTAAAVLVVLLYAHIVHGEAKLAREAAVQGDLRRLAESAVFWFGKVLSEDDPSLDTSLDGWLHADYTWLPGAAHLDDCSVRVWVVPEDTRLNVKVWSPEVSAQVAGLEGPAALSLAAALAQDTAGSGAGPGEGSGARGLEFEDELCGLQGWEVPSADAGAGMLPLPLHDTYGPLTTRGSARICPNVGPLDWLGRLPGMGEELAEMIEEYLAGPDGQWGTADDRAVKDVSELRAIPGVGDVTVRYLRDLLRPSCERFSVYVRASCRSADVWVYALLHRAGGETVIEAWSEG